MVGRHYVIATVSTVAYLGLEARGVEVQCQMVAGLPNLIVVGLADKAVSESKERVRNAIAAIGLALPPKRVTVNLSPADLPKEGSHYDLPIALAVLGARWAWSMPRRWRIMSWWVSWGWTDRGITRCAARRFHAPAGGDGVDLPGPRKGPRRLGRAMSR